jgi:hypothetical protein
MSTELHFSEEALALHFSLQRLESLVDIVVTDENLHVVFLSVQRLIGTTANVLGPMFVNAV